jgi:WD40 repeat protein
MIDAFSRDPLPSGKAGQARPCVVNHGGTIRLRRALSLAVIGGPVAVVLLMALAGAVGAADPIVLNTGTHGAIRPSFSSDGKRLAMYYLGDAVFRVWDVPAGKELGKLPGGWPALSPDGKRVAAHTYDDVVTVWDVETWREVATLPAQSKGGLIAFSPDGKVVATGDPKGRVCLWDAAKGGALDKPGPNPDEPVNALVFSPDGKVLAYATRDGTIKLHEIKGRKALATLKSFKTANQILAFSKDGKVLAYSERAGSAPPRYARVKFWDVAAGKEAGEMTIPFGSEIHFLNQLDDGKRWLAWRGIGMELHVIDPEAKKPILYRAGKDEENLWCVAVSPDRKKLLLSVGFKVTIMDLPDFPPKDAKEKFR